MRTREQGSHGIGADVVSVLRGLRYAWVAMATTWQHLDRSRRPARLIWRWPVPRLSAQSRRAGNRSAQGARPHPGVLDPREAVAGRHVSPPTCSLPWARKRKRKARKRAFVATAWTHPDGGSRCSANLPALLPPTRERFRRGDRRPASHVWQEAENRLHSQKALLEWLLS